MRNLLGNLRYVVRQFRMSPVFTVAAVLTLALGIGGTTAIFTLIHAVMLRSLPVADPAASTGSVKAMIAVFKAALKTDGECFLFRFTNGLSRKRRSLSK